MPTLKSDLELKNVLRQVISMGFISLEAKSGGNL